MLYFYIEVGLLGAIIILLTYISVFIRIYVHDQRDISQVKMQAPLTVPDPVVTNIEVSTMLKKVKESSNPKTRFKANRINAEGEFDFYEVYDEDTETMAIIAESKSGNLVSVIPSIK